MPDLDILERRIAELERKILGNDVNAKNINTTVTDSLLQAQTMITSALSCRDAITTLMDSMTKLDEFLDPLYVAQMIDVECKMTYILEIHENLKKDYEMLKAFEKLQGSIDSENINKLIDNEERIQLASLKSSEVDELGKTTTQNVIKILVGYNNMMKNIKLLFGQMNLLLSNLESGQQQSPESEE
ncbi:uncharacterized protein LOC123678770 [Harmonia axyridis]|uniref:uncharacterized protein LOC123678770 n=1 Tax=Harmonia axyridis TaxID=115357 RepID=UPI001E27875E|nr:uncharacterized protein LOC123678770 [Harmonia axyridis]